MDESETGSANLFGPAARAAGPRFPSQTPAGRRFFTITRVPHLRPPSIDRGVASFLWAAGLGLYIWLGLVGIGMSQAMAAILAGLSFGAIFLFVRIFGENDPRPQQTRSRDTPR